MPLLAAHVSRLSNVYCTAARIISTLKQNTMNITQTGSVVFCMRVDVTPFNEIGEFRFGFETSI